jgi:hypothetical protein
MAYFKIGDTDFSAIVNELKVLSIVNYNAQTNAAGNMIVDYINKKRSIEVGIIPLNEEDLQPLLNAISEFAVTLSYRNPQTGSLEVVNCIIPQSQVEYYTIQDNKVMYNALTLTFTEL